MRVYAESNLVLELVLQQEQSQACAGILDLARRKLITLVLPAYALLEPYQTIVRRQNDRKSVIRAIELEKVQLQRAASLAPEAARLQDAADLLVRASQDALKRLSEVRAQLLQCAEMLVVDATTLDEAEAHSAAFGFEYPDAVMLAAVQIDAAKWQTPSVFLNRNTKDFLDPDVKKYLGTVNCHVIGGFDSGLAYVQSRLSAPSP